MTSAEVQAWITKHGGVDGDPQRSMTGQQIILAKDGSRLVLTRITPDSYRVDDSFEKDAPPGPAASGSAPAPEAQPSSPSQPAASSTSAGGAGMNQQDLEARLGQMGALGAGDFHEETKTEDVPNPKYNPLIPGSPSTLKQVSTYRTWIKPGTNQRLTVRVNADGTYTQTYSGADETIKPPTGTQTPAQTAATEATTAHTQATTQATIKEEAEKDANAAANRGRVTDAQWQAENTRRQAEARASKNQEEANRLAAERLAFDREKDARPDVKVDKVESNGTTYFVTTTTPKDGKPPTIRTVDSTGKEVPGGIPRAAGTEPTPAGGPKPSLSLGDAAADLRAYDEWLDEQVRKGTQNGGISVARADQLREQRRKTWEVAISEQTAIANAQQAEATRRTNERGQTLQNQSSQRSSATQIADTATQALYPYMDKLGAGASGADFLSAVRYAREGAQDFVNGTGANRPVPTVTPGPALSTVNGMPMPGGFLSGSRPNVLGAGSIGGVAAPTGAAPPTAPTGAPPAPGAAIAPVAAGVTATTNAAINPTGANVDAANQAVTAGSNAAFGAVLGQPSGAPSAPAPPSVPQISLYDPQTGRTVTMTPAEYEARKPSLTSSQYQVTPPPAGSDAAEPFSAAAMSMKADSDEPYGSEDVLEVEMPNGETAYFLGQNFNRFSPEYRTNIRVLSVRRRPSIESPPNPTAGQKLTGARPADGDGQGNPITPIETDARPGVGTGTGAPSNAFVPRPEPGNQLPQRYPRPPMDAMPPTDPNMPPDQWPSSAPWWPAQPTPPATPYNPAPGQPGHQMGIPVGQAPPPGFLASMRPGGGYDPGQTAQSMFADPAWDNDIVAQALRELYPNHPMNRVA